MLMETEESISAYSSCESVTDYQESLETNCDDGDSGVITWTPDDDTPDVVYYQVHTASYAILTCTVHVHDCVRSVNIVNTSYIFTPKGSK